MTTIKIDSQVYEQLKNFILESVDFQSVGYEDNKPNTLEEAANTLWNERAKYNRGLNSSKLTQALQGLPSYIDVPFYNDEIINLMYAFGFEDKENSVNEYWKLCGVILADALTEK
jgi:predicted P-loop ATPase